MKDPQAAFHWIIGELQKRKIPFALVGGIAANAFSTTGLILGSLRSVRVVDNPCAAASCFFYDSFTCCKYTAFLDFYYL